MQAQNRFQTSTPVPVDQVSDSCFLSSSGWIILRTSYGASAEQKLSDFRKVARLGEPKRPLPLRYVGIDFGPFIEQILDEVELARSGRGRERGEAFTLCVHISAALFDEEAQGVDGCSFESRDELHESDVRVSAVLEHEFGDIRIRQNQMPEFPAAGILEARAVADRETDDIARKLGLVPGLLPLTGKHSGRKRLIASKDFGDSIDGVAGGVISDFSRRAVGIKKLHHGRVFLGDDDWGSGRIHPFV